MCRRQLHSKEREKQISLSLFLVLPGLANFQSRCHRTKPEQFCFFSSSLCGGGLALRPPALRCKPPSLRSLQLTAVQFWQSLEHGVVQMWFVAVCGTCHGVFCWLTIPNGPAHSQMRSFMGIVSFFWRQTRDSGLAASELEIFSHKFAFGAVCVKQSSICIGLEAAT